MKVIPLRTKRINGYQEYSRAVTDGLNQTMDNVVNGLKRSVTAVRTRIGLERTAEVLAPLFALFATSTGDAKAAVLSGLVTMDNIIARLDGPSRAEVLAGTMPTAKWMASAEEVSKGIQAQAKILKDDTTFNLVETTMKQAYADFANLGAAADSFLTKYKWPLLIGGGGILALILYGQFAPRRIKVALPLPNPLSWFDPEQRDLE